VPWWRAMRTRAWVAAVALLAVGCPHLKKPEHGLELQYAKDAPASLRPVVEKRLAALKVKARIDEDAETLRVRLPQGADVASVKALLAVRGELELCEELPDDARKWCEAKPPEGVTSRSEMPPREGCFLVGHDAAAVRKAAKKDVSGRVVLEKQDGEWRTYAVPQSCLTPGVAEASMQRTEGLPFPTVHLRFDRSGAKQFEALTTRLVGKRLVLLLDGEVQMAPVVQEPITGGAGQLTTGTSDEATVRTLAAALQGGPLPKLTLTTERTFGPPSLR